MQFLETIDRAIGALCRGVLYLTLAVVFVILSANVVLRYVAGTSLASASELPELLFPWMIMAGVVLAAQHGSHIAVVLLTQKLGAARRWVLAGGSLVVAVLYALAGRDGLAADGDRGRREVADPAGARLGQRRAA